MLGRKKKHEDSGGEGWLATYSDMVTLLLTFFILLFSMSSVDAEKWEMIVKAFSRPDTQTPQIVLVPEGDGAEMGQNRSEVPLNDDEDESIPTEDDLPADFNELYEYIKKYVEENNLQGSVELHKDENSVFIRFRDNIFFNPDSAVMRSGGKEILNYLGDCFKNVENQILAIRINGHTATVPGGRRTPGFDRTLSTDRSNKVLIYLEEAKKIEPKKLIAIGYGRNYPIAGNDTEEGRRKNRRVDMMILSNDISEPHIMQMYKILQGDFNVDMYKDTEMTNDVLIPEE